MLDIAKTTEGTKTTLSLTGRLDTVTSDSFRQEINALGGAVTNLVIDMTGLEYVASSGLRVLLEAAKKMSDRGGTCTMTNVPELIMETFEMTGLLRVFTIE